MNIVLSFIRLYFELVQHGLNASLELKVWEFNQLKAENINWGLRMINCITTPYWQNTTSMQSMQTWIAINCKQSKNNSGLNFVKEPCKTWNIWKQLKKSRNLSITVFLQLSLLSSLGQVNSQVFSHGFKSKIENEMWVVLLSNKIVVFFYLTGKLSCQDARCVMSAFSEWNVELRCKIQI